MRDPAELISAYFDDSLADGELAELRAWLAADLEHMRQFARESVIHSRLRDILVQHDMRGLVFEEAFGDAIDPQHIASLLNEEEATAARRAAEAAERARREALAAMRREELLDRKLLRIEEPRVPRAIVYASFAAAAALLVIAGRLIAPTPNPDARTRVVTSRAPAEPPIIAVIANAFDATLRRHDRSLAAGAKLQPGRLTLERGVAEVQFASGAKMIAEGPVELELLTAERAKLISGRVVVHVPQPALGFTLQSDAAAFVDLGTEFGVEVDASGQASMHVLDGEVAFVPEQGGTPSRTLGRGVAAQVSVDGAIRDIPFDQSLFVRRVPTSAYELAVLKSRPLACWRLDQAAPNATLTSSGRLAISSFVNAGIAAVDNQLQGGPARAAKFAGEHDGIDVPADAALGMVSNCTYEAWLLADHAPTGPQRIFSTFDRPRSGMAIGVVDGDWYRLPNDDLKFQLTVYGQYDCLSATPIPAGKWLHLAASVDADGTPTLYVNGEVVEKRFRPIGMEGGLGDADAEPAVPWSADSPTPVGLTTAGQARIGRNPVGSDGAISPERWLGKIGAVAVYDRVLSKQEIQGHFQATSSTLKDESAPR